jgi:hypothetical protein
VETERDILLHRRDLADGTLDGLLARDDGEELLAWALGLQRKTPARLRDTLWGDWLFAAIERGAVDCVRALLDAGEGRRSSSARGLVAPLHAAAMLDCAPAMADFLLSRFDPADTDSHGYNALHLAANETSLSFFHRILADGRVDADARDAWGRTALIFAARAGSLEACRALRAAGASLWLRDRQGLCALDHAIGGSRGDVVRFLAGAGDREASAGEHGAWLARSFEQALALGHFADADILGESLPAEALFAAARRGRGGWLARLLRRRPNPFAALPRTALRLRALEEAGQLREALSISARAGFGGLLAAFFAPKTVSPDAASRSVAPEPAASDRPRAAPGARRL